MATDTTTTAPGTYKGKTAEQWREEASAAHRRSAESFDRCDTDGFLSQWASDSIGRKYTTCANLAEKDGKWEFQALFDLEGTLLDAVYIRVSSRFRPGGHDWVWRIGTGPGAKWFNASWAKNGARRLATDEKKGYRIGMVRCEAYVAMGSGGPMQVYDYIAAKDGADREVLDNGTGGSCYQDFN